MIYQKSLSRWLLLLAVNIILLIPNVLFSILSKISFLNADAYNWTYKDILDRFLKVHLGTVLTTIILSIAFVYYSDLAQGVQRFFQIFLIYSFIYSCYYLLDSLSSPDSIFNIYIIPFLPSMTFTVLICLYHFYIAKKYNHNENHWSENEVSKINTNYHTLLNVIMGIIILLIICGILVYKLIKELDGSYTSEKLSEITFRNKSFHIDNLLTIILSIFIFLIL
tara:strand:+ start:2230 stop:2898 length:669 start_codon:yes stop_codon:yes gene_type:complete